MNSVLAFQLVLKHAESSNVKVRILLKYLHDIYVALLYKYILSTLEYLVITVVKVVEACIIPGAAARMQRVHLHPSIFNNGCIAPVLLINCSEINHLAYQERSFFCTKYVVYFSIWGLREILFTLE